MKLFAAEICHCPSCHPEESSRVSVSAKVL